MNVTNLREKLRRSPSNQQSAEQGADERRKADRRVMPVEPSGTEANVIRIWLTPGERTLIEDLYLLEDK
ncbi:hypothetical protein [Methyloglobulus sp.]|uniref:hypothetical protein n=1 Tax=Methyloglobulus sp. TaxID=2518622 RepID=UPI003989BF67